MMVGMWIDDESCYQALLTHDARFDGQFFVGVTSTGVYCRPVCRVRTPKAANCRFFPSAAAAEGGGFRPCLRCRPELAPGHAAVDAGGRLAQAAASLIEDGALTESCLEELADRLNTSDRHLRRVFRAEFGVSPVAYAQTHRLLLAKRLLTDTDLPLTEVAMAAGFGSLRRFNSLFQQRYRMQPRDLRRTPEAAPLGQLAFQLPYRPPYAWQEHLSFLAKRVIDGVERVSGQTYRRTVVIARDGCRRQGWLQVQPQANGNALILTLSATLAPVASEVLARTKRLFDLGCRPDEIAAQLGALAEGTPGLRVPGAFDGLEMAVRAILGQQITVKAARTLAGRLAESLGEPLETPFDDLSRSFPNAVRLAEADESLLGGLGIIRSRVRAIRALASACAAGDLELSPGVNVESTLRKLRALPGIGDWTAQYIAMRALSWPDAFPHSDFGVMKALGATRPRQALLTAEPWRPWRAYAVMHLWHSLGPTETKGDGIARDGASE